MAGGRRSNEHFTALDANPSLVVTTSCGDVCGANMNGGAAFLGIPFAQPPIGNLRWAAPSDCLPWDGVLNCTRFGPTCPQRQIPGTHRSPEWKKKVDENVESDSLPLGLDEDCLYLNVYTPSLEGCRATVVWIHGGNLTGGSSDDDLVFEPSGAPPGCSNPTILSQKEDLVVVSIHYRLNVFGFLNLPDGTGNCGLLDAAMALSWVKKEITQFGGDCNNITIVGVSAGAHLCSQLLCTPAAKGLFHKAICMSGTAQWTLGSQEEHERRVCEPLARRLGFASLTEMTIEKARQIPAHVLRNVHLEIGGFLEAGVMNIDGETVPRDPLDMMLEGYAKDVKVLSGVVRDEGANFSVGIKRKGASLDELIDDVDGHFGRAFYLMDGDVDILRDADKQKRREIAAVLVKKYQELSRRFTAADASHKDRSVNLSMDKFPDIADSNFEVAAKSLGDHDFALAHLMATWALSQHSEVYAYVFCNGSQLQRKFVGHGSDQAFLFGTAGSGNSENTAPEVLQSLIMGSWAAFARTGDPNTKELDGWKPMSFHESDDESLAFNHMNFEYGRVGTVSFGRDEIRIWFEAAEELQDLLQRCFGFGELRPAVKMMLGALRPFSGGFIARTD
mmetsp:Transcript_90723/g.142460  ORF Transcript_90723/g.142460 Transcript_90723/m.142460 type:complete len:617 (-) Transcript_90723:96-1946(-)|eukprot:CAMPEP_0169249630 /NCGR_PEP_ID=MMETSP1016-20121227/36505_1 /TAXON_ID=342587 /ORGANISM="Karlodinium micrum, Strain CCMP2283" /LENGTH=616 /DNA_ID=CAMNT_0009330559 /DNA_START=152 /DNA_END=2002 /DNA_ORIENTATION=+